MFRDFDFISSIEFPETAEYIEKLIPDDIDTPITFAGSIQFKFRTQEDIRGMRYPIPGLRTNKRVSYVIETKSEMPFKAGDILRFGLSDFARYTIKDVSYGIDKRNEEEYQFTNQDWPGMAGDSVKFKIITLE